MLCRPFPHSRFKTTKLSGTGTHTWTIKWGKTTSDPFFRVLIEQIKICGHTFPRLINYCLYRAQFGFVYNVTRAVPYGMDSTQLKRSVIVIFTQRWRHLTRFFVFVVDDTNLLCDLILKLQNQTHNIHDDNEHKRIAGHAKKKLLIDLMCWIHLNWIAPAAAALELNRSRSQTFSKTRKINWPKIARSCYTPGAWFRDQMQISQIELKEGRKVGRQADTNRNWFCVSIRWLHEHWCQCFHCIYHWLDRWAHEHGWN